MGDAPAPERLVVSMQAPMDGSTAFEAHQAACMLLSPDLVLVPRLSRELADKAHDFHILIAGLPVVEGRAVERIGATFLEAHGLKGSDDNLGLVLRLTRPSRFRLETGASFDSDTLAERLRRYDGDLWRALESLGITRFLSPDGSFEEALSGLPSSTVHSQVAPAQVIELRDLDEVAWSWCIFTPRCIPRWRWVRDP